METSKLLWLNFFWFKR